MSFVLFHFSSSLWSYPVSTRFFFWSLARQWIQRQSGWHLNQAFRILDCRQLWLYFVKDGRDISLSYIYTHTEVTTRGQWNNNVELHKTRISEKKDRTINFYIYSATRARFFFRWLKWRENLIRYLWYMYIHSTIMNSMLAREG